MILSEYCSPTPLVTGLLSAALLCWESRARGDQDSVSDVGADTNAAAAQSSATQDAVLAAPLTSDPAEAASNSAEAHQESQGRTDELAPPDQEQAVVLVRGHRAVDQLRRSPAAVTVVDLEQARRESGDMATVLSRAEGVSVQQVGGLGSPARLSLAGFDDSQVRFFIDGIPLEYQGFSVGMQNVPVQFAERLEIYKGVVPIQFGADSLGGAFNLVTDRRTRGTHASVSYQGGSFDTHRLTIGARHRAESGLFLKGEGYFDTTQNDFPVDVTVGNANGGTTDVTAYRRHDAYRAQGGNVELGIVDQKWAQRLLLRSFVSGYEKELQHNARMTAPYGEVMFGGLALGTNLRYEHDFGQGLSGSFVSGYVHERSAFLDDPQCTYNWLGCSEPTSERGEIRDKPTDQTLWDHTGYLRWNLSWELAPHHQLGLSTAPTYFTRTGKDHFITEPDALQPLGGRREMFKWQSGVEYNVQALARRLSNTLFIKSYLQTAQSEERLTSLVTVDRSVQRLYWGAGDGVRYAFADWAIVKASYEYAVRLPEPVEIFGNGAQVGENLVLAPERSHNVNATLLVERLQGALGQLDASTTWFYRNSNDLILLLGRTDLFFYDNVYRARIIGVEGAATWMLPGEFMELSANATYQDMRNKAGQGQFAPFEGDRIPNKPYLFANGRARFQKTALMAPRDQLSLSWYTRYVHQFLRSWASVGLPDEQKVVDAQLVHSLAVSYSVEDAERREVSFSFDVQNLTNAKVFDFYGVQRPGRAVFFKTVLSY